MATLDQCEVALARLAERIAEVDPAVRRRHVLDRTVSCTVPDLPVIFAARLTQHGLHDVERAVESRGQIRLTVRSDDLVALTEGRLSLAGAWSSGRLRLEASIVDLLRLRLLL